MPNYPREIYLDDDVEERLISFLNTELLNHYGERDSFVDDIKTYQTDYYAKPTVKTKNFPFANAANIVIPLTAIAVEAVHARNMTTLFGIDQFTAVSLPDQYNELDNHLNQFLDHLLLKNSGFEEFADTADLENTKFGSVVGKSGYEVIERTAVRSLGEKDIEFDVIVKKGATNDCVPLANFLMPFTSQDPQTAPWVGEEHLQTPYDVKLASESGFFRDDVYDKLKDHYTLVQSTGLLSSQKYTQKVQELLNQTPVFPKQIGWVEIWLAFDVDGGGKEKEIVVHYHREAQLIMSCRYNWYDDLHRPYRIGNYIPLEHRWTGIGVAKQNEQFQREVTTQHRQRLDNATLANMRMIKVSKLSGYGPGEPVFPGKMWLVDDVKDIDTFQLGEIYPSSYNNEAQAVTYSQQRTGVNDLALGMPQVGTPGSAAGEVGRLQEGNRKFDYTFRNYKKFLQQVALDSICNTAQFGVKDVKIYDYFTRGDEIKQFMAQDVSLIRDQLAMNFQLVGQNKNKYQDRAAWTQLAGFIQQYYKGMIDLAMQSQNPALVQSISQYAMSAATEAFKQILETFEVRNVNKIILEKLILPASIAPALGGMDPTNVMGLLNAGSNNIPGSETNSGSPVPSETQGMGQSLPTPPQPQG